MSEHSNEEDAVLSSLKKKMKINIYVSFFALFIVMCLGVSAVFWFADTERQRDIQNLQVRLNVVADSRAQAVQTWLNQQYNVLVGLARNESLRLYTNVLLTSDEDQPPEEALAHAAYLRTLLQATAARTGFEAVAKTELPANVGVATTAGLALLTPDGKVLAATAGMPPIAGRLRQFLTDTPESERGLLDIHEGPDGTLRIGFVVPVFSPGRAGLTADVMARVFGVRPVGDDFLDTLVQPGQTDATAETYLVRRDGNQVVYVTPLKDGSGALEKTLATNTKDLIDADALTEPGRFHAGRDAASDPAFAVSRTIPGTPWVLVHRISQSEALAQSETRRRALIVVLVLCVLLVGASLIAVWRYGTSLRAQDAALRFQASSDRFKALSAFLDVISDSQPNPLFVTDPSNTLTFGNARAGEVMGVPKTELEGRPLLAMLGRDRGEAYTAINKAVLDSGEPHRETLTFQDDKGQDEIWHSYHCPLHIGEAQSPAVLTSIEDLTELFRERTRREENTRQLIATLVGLVDERDPDSADQSRNVALVARTIAEEMGLDAALIEATEQAASLVNIGKIRVPQDLLTKNGRLTDDEMRRVREAMDDGPEILKGIIFDTPVLETLRQINEHVDGSGRPRGLKDGEILDSAQAVALANTFVALISPRAFREGRSFEDAEELLMTDIGHRFSRRAVLSLLNYLNNKGGRDAWHYMGRHMATKA